MKAYLKYLEKEIESIDRQIKALEQVQYSEDDVIRFKLQGKTLLSHPDKAWQQADSNMKKIIFNFIFEENLKVIDGKIRNTKFSLPYRVLKGKTSSSGGLVELLVQNWNQLVPFFKKLKSLNKLTYKSVHSIILKGV